MAGARSIVDKYLERISVDAFEECQREITDLVRSKHGIYALYKNERLYYVGLAQDLHRRVKQHLQDKHARQWNRFSLYLVHRAGHIKELESLLLCITRPAGNSQVGRLRRATNLKQQLRRMMKQRQKAERDAILGSRSRSTSGKTRGVRRRPAKPKPRRKADLPLKALGRGKRIYATYKGKDYKAVVQADGRIKLNGVLYDTPSAAGRAVRKLSTNGWAFWRIRSQGRLIRLCDARDETHV